MKKSNSNMTPSNHQTLVKLTEEIELSTREFQILEYISYGYTGRDIASRLFVSHHTIVSHRRNLLTKLKATTSASLIRNAFEFGVLSLQVKVA